jgi:hypothetical protein
VEEDRLHRGGRGGGRRRRRLPRLGREDEEVGHGGDEVTAPAAMRRLQGRGGCARSTACGEEPAVIGVEIHRALGGRRRRRWARGGQGHGAGRHTPDPAATRRIRPPRAGSRSAPLTEVGRSAKVSHRSPRRRRSPRPASLRRGRRRSPRPAAPPWLATACRGCSSVEKGRRRDEGESGGAGSGERQDEGGRRGSSAMRAAHGGGRRGEERRGRDLGFWGGCCFYIDGERKFGPSD